MYGGVKLRDRHRHASVGLLMMGVTNQVPGGGVYRANPFRRLRMRLLGAAGLAGIMGAAASLLVSMAAAEGFAVGALAAGAALW